MRLSEVSPIARSSQPLPLPMVRPVTPVPDTRPPVTARPRAQVAVSKSFQVRPVPQRTVRASESISMWLSSRQSMTIPPSQEWWPGAEWPPERSARGSAVGLRGDADERRGPAIDHAVEPGAERVVIGVGGQHDASGDGCGELAQIGGGEGTHGMDSLCTMVTAIGEHQGPGPRG
jgi:hypothetical protein